LKKSETYGEAEGLAEKMVAEKVVAGIEVVAESEAGVRGKCKGMKTCPLHKV